MHAVCSSQSIAYPAPRLLPNHSQCSQPLHTSRPVLLPHYIFTSTPAASLISARILHRVQHHQAAREIWSTLIVFHEGTTQIKAKHQSTYNQ
ncbi:hypothetical protein GUJ93_ZPchr0002g25224 [Zizania palustris]|uniref:Uncharacterized protein n=1 Tax=Zizania palustris TaxID=103762 RepID=A0A8J5S3J0_ZIZPA|nr:hypothetical protein GUJ93_ZPchr0002g25224 [Zizania palustris]